MPKALLLENIHPDAAKSLRDRGFEVETMKGALSEDELIDALDGVDLVGVRSKTNVTARVLDARPTLSAIGCFCIGTNQVDLAHAGKRGIAVFNAPYSNTRSVVELVICDIICLMRRIPAHTHHIKHGLWDKSASGSHEVRGKPLGIIPDARKERPQADNTARKSAHANGRTMRNYLLLALLAIALAGFFYWCFGDDWISIGIFTACIVFPVSILLEGSLTKTERDRIFVIYIIAFFVIFFWAAYEQAGASLTLFASEQTDRVILGWEMPASWIQSFNPFFVVILAAIMPGVWGAHGARLAHQASHRPATAFTGLSRHLLWGERCSAGHQGESHLADGALLHPYHGRNLPLAHRTLHGEQAHAHPLRLADDGDMVPLHRHCQ